MENKEIKKELLYKIDETIELFKGMGLDYTSRLIILRHQVEDHDHIDLVLQERVNTYIDVLKTFYQLDLLKCEAEYDRDYREILSNILDIYNKAIHREFDI